MSGFFFKHSKTKYTTNIKSPNIDLSHDYPELKNTQHELPKITDTFLHRY